MAVVVDLGLMGADGLSTSVGPFGSAADPLGQRPQHNPESHRKQGVCPSFNYWYTLFAYVFPSTYDFIAHFGDIAYADYFIKESWQGYFGNDSLIPNMTSVVDSYNVLLEQFYDQMTLLTSSKAYMVAVGNHEVSHSSLPLAHLTLAM